MRQARKPWRCFSVLLSLLVILSILSPLVAADEPDDGGEALEERVAREAAESLGWPTDVQQKSLRASNWAEETVMMLWPPESAARYHNKQMYTATNGGSYDDESIQWLRILNMGEQGSRDFIDTMVENGLSHSSYQGREGIIMSVGDEICEPGGLLGFLMKYLVGLVSQALAEVFGESEVSVDDVIEPEDQACAEAAAGLIMWTCGSHVFIARDDTGSGDEEDIAAALWMAAEQSHICDIGDSLVLLAGTDDKPNTKTIDHAQKMAQDVNSYYGQNAYGRVSLAYTFLDADGKSGDDDGYSVGPSMADWADRECEFAAEAVRKAFEGGAPREEINLERVIVAYSGPAVQDDPANGVLSTLCCMPPNRMWHEIEVGPDENRSRIYTGSLIMVSEEEGMGGWAHEVGHSLYSKYLLLGKYNRIADRYNYSQPWGQFGKVGYWGLMGSGNYWGDPEASAPTHMTGYSKEAAEWLTYLEGQLDKEYTLTSVENQQAGDTVLRFDDPTTNNPNHYYIMEARDSGAPYGAPESGVVVYQVGWKSSHNYHIVNSISPTTGATMGTGAGNRSYQRPTFRDAGLEGAPTSIAVPWLKMEFRLISEDTSEGYSARVEVASFEPPPVVGAAAGPTGDPAVPASETPSSTGGNAGCGPDTPLPDIDLHAYDAQGRHVGLNYDTGQYERDIPGCYASGDLKDAEEWIFVPEGTEVRYELSSYKTEQFLRDRPEYRDVIRPQKYELTYQRIDANGERTAAKAKGGQIEAGEETDLGGPDDDGLKFKSVRTPGYGKNLPENLWWTGLLLALGAMSVIGWIVALARR